MVALHRGCFVFVCTFVFATCARLRRARSAFSDEPTFKVIETTSIQAGEPSGCLCEPGQFWHWRIKQCISQGPWGYECGFFPSEHHRFVCQTALKCQILDQSKKQVKVEYTHEGAVPASCEHCEPEDKCPAEGQRDCLEETKLSGEACATVLVSVNHEATVTVTKEHTAEATATATATEKATASKTAQGEAAGIKAEVTVTKNATAKATHEATGEHTAAASAEATTSKEGSAQEKRCIGFDAVKKQLQLDKVPRLGPVLAAQVITAGDKAAFDLAYEAALAAAQKNGMLAAEGAAKALAAGKAAKDAEMAAKAKAAEEAAWKAEAGASEAAAGEATAEAKTKADASAAGQAQAVAEGAAGAVGEMGTNDNNPANPPVPTEQPDKGTPPKITEKQHAETKP